MIIHPVKKFPTFSKTRLFITVFTTVPPQVSILSHINPVHTLPPGSFWIHFSIILPSTPRSSRCKHIVSCLQVHAIFGSMFLYSVMKRNKSCRSITTEGYEFRGINPNLTAHAHNNKIFYRSDIVGVPRSYFRFKHLSYKCLCYLRYFYSIAPPSLSLSPFFFNLQLCDPLSNPSAHCVPHAPSPTCLMRGNKPQFDKL